MDGCSESAFLACWRTHAVKCAADTREGIDSIQQNAIAIRGQQVSSISTVGETDLLVNKPGL